MGPRRARHATDPMRTRRHGFRRHGFRRHGLPHHVAGATLTLDSVGNGRRVRVVRVHGGRRLVHRIATLGLVPGSVVTVLRNRGPAIVSLRGTRMVIGRGAAQAIELEEVDE